QAAALVGQADPTGTPPANRGLESRVGRRGNHWVPPAPHSPCCLLASGGGGFAGVEVVPVEDGVEGQEVGALGLPSPEGAEGEHHDVTGTERHIDHQGAVGDGLAAAQGAGEQHVVYAGRELEHDAGARSGVSAEGAASTATATAAAGAGSGAATAAATASA